MANIRNYDFNRLREMLAKEWARRNGAEGAQGGWIYDIATNKAICQGWSAFWTKKKTLILDDITRRHTAFGSFKELLEAKGSYRPTMRLDTDWRLVVLAWEYNFAQTTRKDERRAYACNIPARVGHFTRRDLLADSGSVTGRA